MIGFKKLVSFFMVIVLAVNMTYSTLALSGEWGEIGDKSGSGDVNGDSKVDEIDMGLIKNHIIGADALTLPQIKRADADKSGKVDIRDYNIIYAKIYGNHSSD